MARWANVVGVAVCIVALCVSSGWAVKCYQCNSHPDAQGQNCADFFIKANNVLTECPDNKDQNITYNYCRKFIQNLEGVRRIFRTCALKEDTANGCSFRSSTGQVNVEICSCRGDGCNTGFKARAAASTVVLVAAVSSYFRIV